MTVQCPVGIQKCCGVNDFMNILLSQYMTDYDEEELEKSKDCVVSKDANYCNPRVWVFALMTADICVCRIVLVEYFD